MNLESESAVTPTAPFPKSGPRVISGRMTSLGGAVHTLSARSSTACVCAHGRGSSASAARVVEAAASVSSRNDTMNVHRIVLERALLKGQS